MIETLNPYAYTAKTAEIMARYRPIAPKPEAPSDALDEGSSLPLRIKQSPYLRNLWPQLQARPTRTRKRGRAPLSPASFKKHRIQHLGFCTPCHATSPANNPSLQGFAPGMSPRLSVSNFAKVNTGMAKPIAVPNLVTLPLLPCSPSVTIATSKPTIPELDFVKQAEEKIIDLNCTAVPPLEEKDLLLQFQGPTVRNVIAPQPVRPISSSISVRCINEDPSLTQVLLAPKKPEEVELEVESEALPAVISDSNHRIRMANSAYKEMVGQPECPWLDTMASGDGRELGGTCKRISGEVVLHLYDSNLPTSSNGFSCMARIDWEAGGKKNSITAFCDVVRLFCDSRNYVFTWRFHTPRSREASQSSCIALSNANVHIDA